MKRDPARPRVLYVVYWGALESLGQSLVIPAVTRLAQMGADVTLMTFEKAADLQDGERLRATREGLARHGVEWRPLRYHRGARLHSKVLDAAQAFARAMACALRTRFDIVHARTFMGGLIGRLLARAMGARLVYHNEGFYPDEQVDAGIWTAGSRTHRWMLSLETSLYERADAIIALSHAAEAVIRQLPGVARRQTPTIVVPSCVDLGRFQPKSRDGGDAVNLVYVGSIGGRYRFDRAVAFVEALSTAGANVRFRVVTQMHRSLAEETLGTSLVPRDRWSVTSLPHDEMPKDLAQQDAGLAFLAKGISEHGGSPTKIGEYWACGLPVVTTPNVGDVDSIVRREHVGVIVEDHSKEAYGRAGQKLIALLKEPDIRQRCRRAAEAHYSLNTACERQLALYHSLLNRHGHVR
jgi:glycosyltransferase involved in cell wall biosynthesis